MKKILIILFWSYVMQVGLNAALPKQTDFYLFRHGETNSNLKEVLSGGGDKEAYLTENGEKQARDLSKKISQKEIKLEVIYSSDLQRAAKTAELVLEGLNDDPKPKIILAPQLREILHGPYELTLAKERSLKVDQLVESEMEKLEGRNIPTDLAEGRLDRYYFWKIHPLHGNVSDEHSPIKRVDTFFNETDPVPETAYELYLRACEEFKRIAEESQKNGQTKVGISTHGALLCTLIDADKYRMENVFIPPHFLTKEVIKDGKQIMPAATKVANCALAHFRFCHESKKLEYCGFI